MLTTPPGAAFEQIDVSAIIEISQAIATESAPDKLIDTLLRAALAQSGAVRGLLILMQGEEPRIAAEAVTGGDGVSVSLQDRAVTGAELPATLLGQVLRTRECLVLDDAAEEPPFAADPFIRGASARSILCLPLLNRAKLIGALYLENNGAVSVFTPARVGALRLILSQAATTWDNALLYRDLAAREAKIRRLVDSNIIGIFSFKMPTEGEDAGDPAFDEVNDAFLGMLGYSREEFFSRLRKRSELTPLEWRTRDMRTLLELREGGASQLFEKEYFRKDGSRVPVLLGFASLDAAGTQGVGFVLDLTERKRADEELRRMAVQRAVLETALNRSQEGVYIVDGLGRFLYVNDEACRALGYGRDELLGMGVKDIDPDFPAERIASLNVLIREGGPLTFETKHMRKDGGQFPVEITASHFDYAGQDRFIALARDITERKRTENELRRSEAYLAEAQKLTRTGSWAWAPDHDMIVHCSDEAYRMYGFDPKTPLTFATVMERIHPEDRERVFERTLEGAREKRELRIEYRVVLPDGTVKHLESIRLPVLNEAGEVIEVVGTSMDVTERKRDEEERERLRKLESGLAHVNRISMLGELGASLAHEIKQPITGVVSSANACLRWLARDPPDLERARAAVTRIERDGMRAAEVIDRLRAFYKKDMPKLRKPVDVNVLVSEMTVLLRSEAMRHAVSIRHELGAGIPEVMADRVQLQQVLMNLMLNAIEATKDRGGGVIVGSRLIQDDHIEISVRDAGVGVRAEDVESIFDPFYTTKPQGTGMGLAITRSLVHSHGGKVWAVPNTGPGTTFYVTLPIKGGANA